jgi:anaerobic dimethyl sulfoxide reductase subunit B (iron-sulfur subunit)
MQKGFYIDTSRCTGCYSCAAACKNWNGVAPAVTDKPGTQGPKWRRVSTVESGAYPDAKIINVSFSCMHCGDPACMAVCPTGAISKRAEDGIVVVDQQKCIGCHYCFFACPFGVPQYGADGTMQKCTYCLDRTENGQDPACVATCPAKAISAGTMEELAQLAANRVAERLAGSTLPSVLISGK